MDSRLRGNDGQVQHLSGLRVKFAMIGRGNWLDANRKSAIVCNYRAGRMVMVAIIVVSGLRVFV